MPRHPRYREDQTLRQRLVALLEAAACDQRDISQALRISEKDVTDHLEHVRRSMAADGRALRIEPAECLACGYVFRKRRRFSRPGRCPRCRQTRISLPRFRIAPSIRPRKRASGVDSTTIMHNIILTGFMGTGKSSVGKLLAKHLGYTFVDTDAVIEARTGMAVHAIFEQRGEAAFRAMEAALARELADGRRQVIATGGRLMLDEANAAVLSRNGIVFCLWAEPEDILSRVIGEGAAARPLLAGSAPQERIEALLAERREGYRQFAPISTSGRTIAEVVQALLERLPSVDGANTALRE